MAYRDDETETARYSQLASSPSLPLGVVSQRSANTLDQSWQLAEVTSNVMTSKFRIQRLCDRLPSEMGVVTIKTSFLHIQPRKVVVILPQMELDDSGIDFDHLSFRLKMLAHLGLGRRRSHPMLSEIIISDVIHWRKEYTSTAKITFFIQN